MPTLPKVLSVLAMGLALVAGPARATVTPLDLQDFFTLDTEVQVLDANTATMSDSASISFVSLTLDPGVGDLDVIAPLAGRSLTFSYALELGANNVDEFSAYLFDAATGPLAVLDSFTTAATGSGNVSFDLTPHVGTTLGLQFELFDTGIDLGAVVTISSLALMDPMVQAPAPSAALLLLAGLCALGRLRFARRVRPGRITPLCAPVHQCG